MNGLVMCVRTCMLVSYFSFAAATVGCGDTTQSSGSPPNDASPPESWLVHVEVVGKPPESEPLKVLTSRPDGSIDALTETDASGKVDVSVAHLGAVSVFQTQQLVGYPAYHLADTFFDVDHDLEFRVQYLRWTQEEPHGQVRFVPDTSTFPSGTVAWSVEPACELRKQTMYKASEWILYEAMDACQGATETFAVAFALDAGGRALAAKLLDHLPLTNEDQTITVSFASSNAFTNFELDTSLAGIDPNLVSASIRSTAPGTSYGLDAHVSTSLGYDPMLSSPLVSPVLTEFFSEYRLQTWGLRPDIPGVLVERKVQRYSTTSTLPTDFAADPSALAPMQSISDLDWTLPQRPKRTYSIAPGPQGDCVYAGLAWTDASGSQLTSWLGIRAARPSGSFQVPEIPDSLADYVPSPDREILEWTTNVGHHVWPLPCSDRATWGDSRSESASSP